MKFLVIGNLVDEKIIRSQDGATRQHAGGVGAIMARELALAGAETTLIANRLPPQQDKRTARLLEEAGVETILTGKAPYNGEEGSVTITTRRGEPVRAKGRWPRMADVAKLVLETAPDFDWVLVSLVNQEGGLKAALKAGQKVAVNVTTNRLAERAHLMRGANTFTMNSGEAQKIQETARDPRQEVIDLLRAQTVMITHGASGRTLWRAGQNPRKAPATAVPKGADFIGAGDAATAGLVYAQAHGLDPQETVDRFIGNLLERNAQSYRP